MSGDPEQEYFADGVVEDILTALSRFQGLFVIARNSSFTYKGKAVDVRQVGRELGVRYVLEGSVRKAAGRVRITAQLIETASGKHLWADRFDGALTDIFDLQDDITSSVVAAIGSRLEEAEIERSTQKTTDNLDAYDHLLRGKASAAQGTKAAHAEALDLFYRAIDLDPNYALAYACAAWSYGHRKAHRWMVDSEVEIGEADRLARIAVKLGKNDSRALALAGWALAYVVQDLHAGTALTDRAIDLNANLAANWLYGAWVSIWRGEPEQAVQRLGRAMRLSPLEPQKYGFLSALAHAQFQLNQFEQAAANAEKALAEQPSFAPAAKLAAAAYGMSDRRSHVIEAVLRLRALDPSLRISNLKDAVGPYVPEQRAQYEEGLRKAGLPE